MSFSNIILTWFTYFLCARTMFKHTFGLIPVTHKDSGVQLNQDNWFWVIQLSQSIFPTKLWACAGYPVHSRHMSPFWFMFLLCTDCEGRLSANHWVSLGRHRTSVLLKLKSALIGMNDSKRKKYNLTLSLLVCWSQPDLTDPSSDDRGWNLQH